MGVDADGVASLLRPAWLRDAQARPQADALGHRPYEGVEDRAPHAALALGDAAALETVVGGGIVQRARR